MARTLRALPDLRGPLSRYRAKTVLPWMAFSAILAALVSCGGSGGNASPPAPAVTYTAGSFPASSTYANTCAAPRSGTDPTTGTRYPDRQGTLDHEKAWLRSWTNELYLWYREVPDLDWTSYTGTPQAKSPLDYFDALKTPATTTTGSPKDRFHFSMATSDWQALAQSGVGAGYGAQWVIITRSPPRQVVVAYDEPGSPAALAVPPVARGAEVLSVDGVDLVNGTNVDALNAGLFPAAAGEAHVFSILDVGAGAPRTVTLISANVTSAPVPDVTSFAAAGRVVGYVLFNDHLATAEKALFDAVAQLDGFGVDELVLDIRYNGGGFLDIASELAFMIAGPTATAGRAFEKLMFNDRYPTWNPVTGTTLTPIPFHSTAHGFTTLPPGQALPHLDLPRVFVLTGPGTCSASESVINSLRGIGVQVIQVGSTTCGKPYGFYPQDNCGTTYFSIEFQGLNDQGFGDYGDGFVPGGTGAAGVTGCQVADDFTHALGDPAEARLDAALGYLATQTCPPATSPILAGAARLSAIDGRVAKPVWRENRIMRR